MAGDGAGVFDLQHSRQLAGQRREEPSEPLGQGYEGPHDLVGLGRGHIDGEGDDVPGQGENDLLGDGHARLVLGFAGARPQVRRHHHFVELQQR